jgi:ABC-2 type transport system ATP-binding protein
MAHRHARPLEESSMAVLIEASDLHKRFGDIRAVDGISLRVQQGEVLGFLGPNGAGKSTTMKMLAGFLEPDVGSARIAGVDVAEHPKLAKRKLGYLPEGAPCYGEMTTRAFLAFIAEIRGFDRDDAKRRVAAAVDKTQLASVLEQRIETLSKGFKRRVAIAQALVHDPDALILDEPTDGLDPIQKYEMRDLIRAIAPQKAIIISTHILEEVEAVCTRAIIIAKGRMLADATPSDLLEQTQGVSALAITIATADPEGVPLGERPKLQVRSTVFKRTFPLVNGAENLEHFQFSKNFDGTTHFPLLLEELP